MIKPEQPENKPGPKLTKILEIFFKALQARQKIYANPKASLLNKKQANEAVGKAAHKVNDYKDDAALNRLSDEINRITKLIDAGNDSSALKIALRVACEEWWAYLKSPWEGTGKYEEETPKAWYSLAPQRSPSVKTFHPWITRTR